MKASQKSYEVELTFELGNLIKCETSLYPITVIMGPPRSGKTILLRLLYDVLYYKKNSVPPLDLIYLASNIITTDNEKIKIRLEDCELECNKIEEKEPACQLTKLGSFSKTPVFIPNHFEDIIRYNFIPPFEPFYSFNELLIKIRTKQEHYIPDSLQKYFERKTDFDAVNSIRIKNGRFFEEIPTTDKYDIQFSSSGVIKLGILEKIAKSGLFDSNTMLLMDEPESNLHPRAQAQLVLLLHALAGGGVIVVLATHDLIFLDLLRSVETINKYFKTEITSMPIKIIDIDRKECKELDQETSAIKGYTDVLQRLLFE